ncbi:MAG: hypothetical protein RLZZ15_3698 [Verrucomicrobiota bacterium]|jgi:hypothetical protein
MARRGHLRKFPGKNRCLLPQDLIPTGRTTRSIRYQAIRTLTRVLAPEAAKPKHLRKKPTPTSPATPLLPGETKHTLTLAP